MFRVSILGKPLSEDPYFDTEKEAVDYAIEQSKFIDDAYGIFDESESSDIQFIAYGGVLFEYK